MKRRVAALAGALWALLAFTALAVNACGGAVEMEVEVEVERRIPVPGMFVYTSANDLWIQDEQGARLLIAAEPEQQLIQPAISPDGRRVAYVVFQLTQGEGVTVGTDLAVASLDNPVQEIVLGHERQAEFVWNPRWAPDGAALLFTQESAPAPIRVARLTLATGVVETLREDARDADIAADGTRIVFVSEPYSGDPHLVVRTLADGAEVELDPQREWQPRPYRIPRFSADGESVLFSAGQYLPQVAADTAAGGAGRNGPEDIWSYQLASGELRQLAAIAEDQPDFTLSRDGRHVLVFGAFGTYLIAASGTEAAYAIAPGEFHGWIDWQGAVSDQEWAEIRASVFADDGASP